jgi:hypothetical protein
MERRRERDHEGGRTVKRPGYREAIEWIALNDDTEWLNAEYGSPSVTACLVADLFGVTTERVTADLRRYYERNPR